MKAKAITRVPKSSTLMRIKEVEPIESLKLVMDDDECRRVMAAWTVYRPKFKDSPVQKGESVDEAYFRLWDENQLPDWVKLSGKAGLPYLTTCSIFTRLISLYLVYPDGSITMTAGRMLRAEVGGYVNALIPRLPKKKDETKTP